MLGTILLDDEPSLDKVKKGFMNGIVTKGASSRIRHTFIVLIIQSTTIIVITNDLLFHIWQIIVAVQQNNMYVVDNSARCSSSTKIFLDINLIIQISQD